MTCRLLNRLVLPALLACAMTGCRSMWPTFWPFPERELTSFRTPAMRIDAISEFRSRSTGLDTPEQRELTDQLARQMQIEPDPLVREACVRAIAEYKTPMAKQVLEAALSDDNEAVRLTSCKLLGKRADESSTAALAKVLREDQDLDVRVAAAEALGGMKSPEAIQALVVALDDRDPALQYAGVQSMKSITGKDYGPDVQSWRVAATGGTPPPPATPTVAERLKKMRPF